MQGFNMGRYYPPPESSSAAPTFNKTHPLGARARKLKTQGILTVRFEMPFAIWCSTCPKPTIIGQGVRFNAEKKKVGNYFSTPIWSFRMKHAACGGAIEIRTDPKATEYVVIEGAKRRDYGDARDEEEGEGGIIVDEAERARRREDAMAGLEGKREEEVVKKESGQRIEELRSEREKWWSDPYEASRFVRKGFRRERKERHREATKAEGIKAKFGLGLDLLPAAQEDEQRAKLVDFGVVGGVDAASKPLFDASKVASGSASGKRLTKAEKSRAKTKEDFQHSLQAGTRAALDPFDTRNGASKTSNSGLQQALSNVRRSDALTMTTTTQLPMPQALVAYDSD